jgi:hypothetical protein
MIVKILICVASRRGTIMRDDLDDDVTIEYEFGDSKPSCYYEEEPIVKTRAATKYDKARQTIYAKRKEFDDEIWRKSGPETWLRKPDPAFSRRYIRIIRDANYADNCLKPKEFGFVLSATVCPSRSVLGKGWGSIGFVGEAEVAHSTPAARGFS